MDRERNVTTTAHPFGAKSDFGVRTKKKEGVTQPTNIEECFKPPAGPVYESETPCPHYLSSPPQTPYQDFLKPLFLRPFTIFIE